MREVLCFDDCSVLLLRCLSKNKDEGSEDVVVPVLDDEDPTFLDDPDDLGYQPQSQRYAYLKHIHLTWCRQSVGDIFF